MFPHATCLCMKSVNRSQSRQWHTNNNHISPSSPLVAASASSSISSVTTTSNEIRQQPWILNESCTLIKVDILPVAQIANILKAEKERSAKAIEVKQVSSISSIIYAFWLSNEFRLAPVNDFYVFICLLATDTIYHCKEIEWRWLWNRLVVRKRTTPFNIAHNIQYNIFTSDLRKLILLFWFASLYFSRFLSGVEVL